MPVLAVVHRPSLELRANSGSGLAWLGSGPSAPHGRLFVIVMCHNGIEIDV